MSLFGSIQLGANTLRAMQIGLQVTGNNIANANTPGFIRQEVTYSPAPVQKIGNLVLGLGVQVDGIVDKIDKFVLDRLVGARGDRAGAEVPEQAYSEIENLLNGLSGETDLSTQFTSFINSFGDLLTDPTSAAARNLVVTQGESLAASLNSLSQRATSVRAEFDNRVVASADEINTLSEQIRRLNIQVSTVEGGGSSGSQAGGLRVERQQAVDRLSEILGVSVTEQPSGAVNVSVGGEFLVFEGQRRAVEIDQIVGERGHAQHRSICRHQVAAPDQLGRAIRAVRRRATTLSASFLDGLDQIASVLANEFNKIHTQGQGQCRLQRFDQRQFDRQRRRRAR